MTKPNAKQYIVRGGTHNGKWIKPRVYVKKGGRKWAWCNDRSKATVFTQQQAAAIVANYGGHIVEVG